MLRSAVHEDLLAEGDQRDGQGDDSNTKLDNVLGLVLIVNLKEGKSRSFRKRCPPAPRAHLFPRLGGNSHLINAGSGPVSQSLASGLVLHQPAGSQE